MQKQGTSTNAYETEVKLIPFIEKFVDWERFLQGMVSYAHEKEDFKDMEIIDTRIVNDPKDKLIMKITYKLVKK